MANVGQGSKQKRMRLVYQFVQRNVNGVTEREVSEELHLERRTVNNYLRDLEMEGKVYKEDHSTLWLALPYENVKLRGIDLSPEEAMTLYLAVRLLVKQHDKRNDAAQLALTKLAEVLTGDANVGHEVYQAALELARRPGDERYAKIFRTMMQAYIYRRKVSITYKPLNKDTFDTVFSPYLFEPSAIGYATYAIGHSSIVNDRRTYKLQRIEQATLTREEYDIPPDFPGLEILRHAWSIIHGEELIPIKLRFSPQVAERVRETQWHPSQDPLTDDPDKPGWLIWTAKVADLTDLTPWVRSWGADCEVLGPEGLREELKQTTFDLGKLYQTMTTAAKLRYHLLYAKTNPDNAEQIHLLLYHLIDIGQVALLMWRKVLTDSIRQRLAQMLNLTVDQAGQLLAFLAALHDLGKAGPAYQHKYAPEWLKKALVEAGLVLRDPTGYSQKTQNPKTPHAIVSTWALMDLLPELLHLDQAFSYKIAVALGGHHGSWPAPGATENINDSKYPGWDEVRRELVWEVRSVFQPPQAVPSPDKTDLNTFLTIFSGLVSVADWVGSRNKECFGFVEQVMSTRHYALRSAEKARQSLADLGWLGWQPTGHTPSFGDVFAYLNFKAPRGVQTEVIDAAQHLPAPSLLILEAPTGIGKTETALYLADSWLQQQAGRGLYVAMPTQATSNQMYERIGDFLNHRYPDQRVNYHLVHGQAAWQDELKKKVELQTVGDDQKSRVLAESWFTPRKRTLLAPFGVGTVDQTFMSILQTRHFFVRLFGLSHKVIIFDEVHAYDTFMNTLFERLLTWLNAIGTSVIILSATLPAETRRKLVKAYCNRPLTQNGEYPGLTIAAPDREPAYIELPKPTDVTVQLTWEVGREPNNILAYLRRELAGGGCAAVICNTVRPAQEIYRVLDEARQAGTLDIPEEDLILFHARFPPVWRKEIEEKVLAKFGKPTNGKPRPHKAIVVATQVIEQSLDLDFDLMLTDLAPIDLIIQRAGRLHRHDRSQEERHGLPRRLVITEPTEMDADGLPNFDVDEYIYARYVLLRSFYTLKAKGGQAIFPTDTTNLIEQVYGNMSLLTGLTDTQREALQAAERKMKDDNRKAEQKAKGQLILAPNKSRLLKQAVAGLDEDNPEVHQTFRAQTRDIDTGISLICLHRKAGRHFIHTPEGEREIDLTEEVPFHQIKYIQQNSITVQHKALFYHFIQQEPPSAWQKQAALRHQRVVIFEEGQYTEVPNYILKLNRTFGLETIKQEAV